MSFRLVPKSVTLNDRVHLWQNLCTSLFYFVVRVRCRRKESSRSLSHLLMSFLFYLVIYVTIIYKVLCINHILHAVRYSFTFTDI